MNNLNNNDSIRYHRQMILRDIGIEGQVKLKNAKVCICGAGGLGSPILYYLAAAGVGTLGIVDYDVVKLSNLNRQILHSSDDLESLKTVSAKEKLSRLNPNIQIIEHNVELKEDHIEEIFETYDVIVDAVDTIKVRYLITDTCYKLKKPLIEGAVVGFSGILTTIIPDQTPCYRCLYPFNNESNEYPTCNEIGILGAITGVIGSLQALEVIKLITGSGECLLGRLLTFEGLDCEFNEIPIIHNKDCILCGKNKSL
ncbi:MAG: HesA/MoeB/ThiF family protein [Erysipelotrichaceae bacterium]